MRLLLLTSHSIAEYDDLRMLSDLGYDTFSIGAYTDPTNPSDDKRPALDLPRHEDLELLCSVQRDKHATDDASRAIDWAKADLHPDLVDWADAIIVHHFPETWIYGQWERIKHKRVIWRTCGQSSPDGGLERLMGELDGLQVVRYSPRERSLPAFAGEDALIRFGKYPADYGPWRMGDAFVGNLAQDMVGRGNALGLGFWLAATEGLPVKPAGPKSELLRGGIGALGYYEMLDYLAGLRCYLYTGTYPASYTLGLMEAMLSGVPVVSIGAKAFGLPDLFEAATRDDLPLGEKPMSIVAADSCFDDPYEARKALQNLMAFPDKAATISGNQRQRAIDLFSVDVVGPHWKAFLG